MEGKWSHISSLKDRLKITYATNSGVQQFININSNGISGNKNTSVRESLAGHPVFVEYQQNRMLSLATNQHLAFDECPVVKVLYQITNSGRTIATAGNPNSAVNSYVSGINPIYSNHLNTFGGINTMNSSANSMNNSLGNMNSYFNYGMNHMPSNGNMNGYSGAISNPYMMGSHPAYPSSAAYFAMYGSNPELANIQASNHYKNSSGVISTTVPTVGMSSSEMVGTSRKQQLYCNNPPSGNKINGYANSATTNLHTLSEYSASNINKDKASLVGPYRSHVLDDTSSGLHSSNKNNSDKGAANFKSTEYSGSNKPMSNSNGPIVNTSANKLVDVASKMEFNSTDSRPFLESTESLIQFADAMQDIDNFSISSFSLGVNKFKLSTSPIKEIVNVNDAGSLLAVKNNSISSDTVEQVSYDTVANKKSSTKDDFEFASPTTKPRKSFTSPQPNRTIMERTDSEYGLPILDSNSMGFSSFFGKIDTMAFAEFANIDKDSVPSQEHETAKLNADLSNKNDVDKRHQSKEGIPRTNSNEANQVKSDHSVIEVGGTHKVHKDNSSKDSPKISVPNEEGQRECILARRHEAKIIQSNSVEEKERSISRSTQIEERQDTFENVKENASSCHSPPSKSQSNSTRGEKGISSSEKSDSAESSKRIFSFIDNISGTPFKKVRRKTFLMNNDEEIDKLIISDVQSDGGLTHRDKVIRPSPSSVTTPVSDNEHSQIKSSRNNGLTENKMFLATPPTVIVEDEEHSSHRKYFTERSTKIDSFVLKENIHSNFDTKRKLSQINEECSTSNKTGTSLDLVALRNVCESSPNPSRDNSSCGINSNKSIACWFTESNSKPQLRRIRPQYLGSIEQKDHILAAIALLCQYSK